MPEGPDDKSRPRPCGGFRWPVAFVDVEASSLERGTFPIEVGICGDDLVPESWLVAVHPTWSRLNWSRASEAVHGIGMALLDAEGLAAEEVASLIAAKVAGRAVHSDSPPWDGHWLSMIFEAAGRSMPFAVRDETEAYACLATDDPEEAASILVRWQEAARVCGAVYPATHRAGPDALAMAATFRMTVDPAFADMMRAFDGNPGEEWN